MPRRTQELLDARMRNAERSSIDERMTADGFRRPDRLIDEDLHGMFRIVQEPEDGDGTGFHSQILLQTVR